MGKLRSRGIISERNDKGPSRVAHLSWSFRIKDFDATFKHLGRFRNLKCEKSRNLTSTRDNVFEDDETSERANRYENSKATTNPLYSRQQSCDRDPLVLNDTETGFHDEKKKS